MVPEAPLEQTEAGVVPSGDGWFVLNAKDARWYHADGRTARTDFEGDTEFAELGIHVNVLQPGQSLGMYHWEAAQEDFLVLAGEALLLVEGEERPLRQWDFVHCPPGTNHIVIGAGDGPSVVLAVGARNSSLDDSTWGAYTVDALAQRHGVGVERTTSDADEAYADWKRRQPTRYREGWLNPPAAP